MAKIPQLLIIDDDPNLRKTLSDILKIKGYAVVTAADGKGGIAQAQQSAANVALIDLKLPDMSGIEVMEKIKANSPFTEAIILTGYASLDTAVAATNKGAFSYLLKPYEIEDLLLHISHAVARQRDQEEIRRLASFPKLNPNPVVELTLSGEVTYANPAAEKQFPDLLVLRELHPLFTGLEDTIIAFRQGWQIEALREVRLGDATYEQYLYYVPENSLIRISVLDISERKGQESRIKGMNALLLAMLGINQYLLDVKSEQDLYWFVCKTLKGLDDIVGVLLGLKMPDHVLKPVAWAGFDEAMVSSLKIRWDESGYGRGLMGTAVREGTIGIANDIENDPRYLAWKEIVEKWGLRSAAAAPLIADQEVMGVLVIYSRKRNAFSDEITKFLAEVANDIAIGVRSLHLDHKLNATLNSLRKSLDSTVEAIASMMELRDPYTVGHQQRVAQLSCAIGKELGLPERQIDGLRVTGYLHDIGKIAVPAEILSRPTELTETEHALVRAHARSGYDILKNLEFPWPVAEAILQHHERLDGSGYPRGLRGDEIILEARILMVADVVEAIASHRPYRASRGMEAALSEIAANKGKLYDEKVVDVCIELFTRKGFHFEEIQAARTFR
ncbi:MAG TPA: HD domain-containing phosphohydrolase [Gallionella sp.]|nr:HD domain-containing phosphohydrolase [Gallionella sp.]